MGPWRGRGRAPPAPRAPAGARSEDHGDAAVLGLVPMVGKGETFHYLLSLDSSVLDRGREVRQLKISERPGLTNEANPGAHPVHRSDRRVRTAFETWNRSESGSEITKVGNPPAESQI